MQVIKNPKADVRAHYGLYIKLSLIISIALIIAAFTFFPKSKVISKKTNFPPELIPINMIDNTVQKTEPPKLPDPPRIIEATIDETTEDILLVDTDLNQNAEMGPVKIRPDLHKVDDSEEPFIPFPEQFPEPIGGIKSIMEKVHYTEIAKKIGLTGTVIIEAAIDKEGNVISVKLIRGIGGGLNEVSLNAVQQTKFKPGLQGGKPVKVKIKIPIKFILE